MQGLSDALADVGEGVDETPTEEYTMMLEVMMADRPGRLRPPTFSWNAGMVVHVLKSDPVLRELEHMQVDGLGWPTCSSMTSRAIRVLGQDTMYAIRAHVEKAFSEWISCSTHFSISLLPLMEAWQRAITASDCQRLRSRAKNFAPSIPVENAGGSDPQNNWLEVCPSNLEDLP